MFAVCTHTVYDVPARFIGVVRGCSAREGGWGESTDDVSQRSYGAATPQYLAELVVARVPGLKGLLDNWLKGLSLLTLLGPANAPRIIKSFLGPSRSGPAAGCRKTRARRFSPVAEYPR